VRHALLRKGADVRLPIASLVNMNPHLDSLTKHGGASLLPNWQTIIRRRKVVSVNKNRGGAFASTREHPFDSTYEPLDGLLIASANRNVQAQRQCIFCESHIAGQLVDFRWEC